MGKRFSFFPISEISERVNEEVNGQPMAFGTSRIAWLDGIRGVAIILVLISHYVVDLVQTIPGSALAYVIKSLSLAWCGVDLFFVLSGFLIATCLSNSSHLFDAGSCLCGSFVCKSSFQSCF